MYFYYPPELPVSEQRDRIITALREHQVLIVVGDTGSGKTTQIPKMCIEAGQGTNGMIGCTQPRRLAAVSVADRVAEETRSLNKVGFKIRFHDRTSPETLIKFMTDGILLAETRHDPELKQYDTLIIDEAHERSLNIDFLLGYIKQLLPARPDLKVIISSATIDAEKFSTHFAGAPVLSVSGYSHPITTLYREIPEQDEEDISYVHQAISVIEELAAEPLGGDILVFMPTERDIFDTLDGLEHLNSSHLLLPLFGRLSAADQRKVFRPSRRRKIIVATNVAETSITVPGISFVIDTGLARISRYNPRTGTTSLKISRISRASCEQRRGRCGRTGPGTCIRLYSEEDFLLREDFTPPEIQRSNLAEVILQMIALKLGSPDSFPFIDAPSGSAIRDGYQTLTELGALTGRQHLTPKGRLMSRLPLDPRISRIIIESLSTGSTREIVILAAALTIQDPRIRPLGKEGKAEEAHQRFVDNRSDFLTLLNIWQDFFGDEDTSPSSSQLSRYCRSNYLSWQRMREWKDVQEQILRLLREAKQARLNATAAGYEAIHMALASGFLRNICLKKEKNVYITAGGREVVLFPGSALYNKGPQWAVAAELTETTQLFAKTVATIDVDWLERLGGTLCKRSWSEPHWEKRSGKVIAFERVTLFGLTIVARRKVEYAKINESTRMEARDIFIRSALMENQLGGKYHFLEHNVALVARFQEMEERFRRRDIVVEPEVLYQFYASRLDRVYDRFTLNRMLRQKNSDSLLRMTEEDICSIVPEPEERYRYPLSLQVGDFNLELSYLFHPGHEADGVTVRIPGSLLDQINPQTFEWLVPGLLPEKILFLLRRLPKNLRRRLVPLPDTVDRILDNLAVGKGSLYQQLEHILARRYQISVQRADWQADLLPPHLRMRFLLVDKQGNALLASRIFDDLLADAALPQNTKNISQSKIPPVRTITATDLDDITRTVSLTDHKGQVVGLLFPSLEVDEIKNTVQLRYIEDEIKSRQLNRTGLQFLYGRQFKREMNAIRTLCKASLASHSASWLSLGARLTGGALRSALQAFLLDDIFGTWNGEIPSSRHFQNVVTTVSAQDITRSVNELLDRIHELIRQRRLVSDKITKWAARTKEARSYLPDQHKEFLNSLEQILPARFLETLRAQQLKHRPRYLQALALRIERAEHSPLKDRKKAEQLVRSLSKVEEMAFFSRPTHACQICQEEYLTMLEEYKVSLFAPELGTAQPVSEKRLLQKWQEVENLCRRAE
ncbi:MAG: ATP-dependent RNA helicase HrpA [Desulfobulbus sp.]|nr:ATP-dependent RNA helicase HrpA [Desulfobulbus sp.]